jgi:hypothetical protein
MFPYNFHSASCFRRQFLCKMWPVQSAFLLFTLVRKFLSSLTPCNTCSISHTIGPKDLLQNSPAPRFKTFRVFLIYFPECPIFSHYKAILQIYHFTILFPKFMYYLLVKRFFFLWNVAFAKAILDLTSRMHLSSSVVTLPIQLQSIKQILRRYLWGTINDIICLAVQVK